MYEINPQDTPDGMEEIKVNVGTDGWSRTESFVGRWLLEPDPDETQSTVYGYQGAVYGVATTRRGRIAVHVEHVHGVRPASLSDYDDLEAAAKAKAIPPDILAMIDREFCGYDRPVQRDI